MTRPTSLASDPQPAVADIHSARYVPLCDLQGRIDLHAHAALVVLALILAPVGARAADLVVWWEEAWYPEEERAIAEMIAAFEHQAGMKVELVRLPTGASEEVQAALEAGQPPDFLWGLGGTTRGAEQWAYEDRLVDLAETLGPQQELFDSDLLERATLLNGRDGEPNCRWGA